MRLRLLSTAVLTLLLGCRLAAQEALVRTVAKVSMPTGVDSNSPAFWRDGRLFWFGSHGRPWLSEGRNQFGPWETREVNFETADAWPHWMEAVWPDVGDTLWGWYHAEPIGLVADSTLTAPKIGAVVSYDGGKTLRDIGVILESGDPLDALAKNGYFAGGHGDFSVIPDRGRKYFYFLFDNYGGPTGSQGVCIARMAFEDRFDPVGRVWKYYNGNWQEAGRGGRVTPIFPVRRGWQLQDPDAFWGPSIHWNTHLNCYVMLLNRASGEPGWSQEGVYVSYCSDLSSPESWTEPRKILDKSQFPGWYFFYPQVMGLEPDGTDTRAGATARLYVGGISKWEIDFIPKLGVPSEPKLEMVPASGAVVAGAPALFTISATGTAPFTFKWLKNGSEIPGATSATYTIPVVTANDAGIYTVIVSNGLGAATSNVSTLTVAAPPADPSPPPPPPPMPAAYLTNLSLRSSLASSDAVLTLGYVVQSAATKQLVIRAIGPSLAQFGILGAVPDPRLEIYDAYSNRTAENDDWLPGQAALFASLGAFALPLGSADASVVVDVPSGPGTAQVRGSAEGIVLVEIYDPSASRGSKIVNVSARTIVGTGDNVLIGGFSLGGSGSKQLLIRAVGPHLENFGVSNPLAAPVLQLYDANGLLLAENDAWDAALAPTFASSGAYPLIVGSRDAALAARLVAGKNYTVVVRNRGHEPGEVLLEIYEIP